MRVDRIYYVVANEQRLRLAMLFEAARTLAGSTVRPRPNTSRSGWCSEPTANGSGPGPATCRSSPTCSTSAVQRAEAVVAEKAPDLDADERAAVAKAVGIGAIKYGDLSSDRIKDYLFDLDQMVSFDGNTAPYLQYAHARIQSVFRRGESTRPTSRAPRSSLVDPAEHRLALRLGEFEGVLHKAAEGVELHRICGYLFDLATAFTAFYEHCPVLRAEDDKTRASRLVLCDVTARVLATGLSLLGIAAPPRM